MKVNSVLTRSQRKQAGLAPPSPFFVPSRKIKDCIEVTEETLLKGEQQQNLQKESFLWVQCDNCHKWRKIHKSEDETLGERWYCHMNSDPSHRSCDQPEEECCSPKSGWLYEGFIPGELVWAKWSKYPPWPSVISRDPWCSNTFVSPEDGGILYHVEFLGRTRSHRWLPQDVVVPYGESCSLGGSKMHPRHDFKHDKRLQYAINEADGLLGLTCEERLGTCRYTVAKKEKLDKSKCKRKAEPTVGTSTKSDATAVGASFQQSSSLAPLSQIIDLLKQEMKAQPLLSSLLLQNIVNDTPKANKETPKSNIVERSKDISASTQSVIKTAAVVDAEHRPRAASKKPASLLSAPQTTHLSNKTPAVTSCPTVSSKSKPISKRATKHQETPTTRAKKRKTDIPVCSSILQYFEPQASTNASVCANKDEDRDGSDKTICAVPELKLQTLHPFTKVLSPCSPISKAPVSSSSCDQVVLESTCLKDLEAAAENDLLAIEQMMSRFESTTIDLADYEKLAMEEMSQIEELMSLFPHS